MGALLVEASLPFLFCLPVQCRQLLNERIYSHRSKFFHLRVESMLKGFICQQLLCSNERKIWHCMCIC